MSVMGRSSGKSPLADVQKVGSGDLMRLTCPVSGVQAGPMGPEADVWISRAQTTLKWSASDMRTGWNGVEQLGSLLPIHSCEEGYLVHRCEAEYLTSLLLICGLSKSLRIASQKTNVNNAWQSMLITSPRNFQNLPQNVFFSPELQYQYRIFIPQWVILQSSE